MKERKDFCIECRADRPYHLEKKTITKLIKDKEYKFDITTAVCDECGEEMSIPGLIDRNIKEIDAQYRAMEEIVTIEDIEKLMKIYKLGKAPMSLALCFGEVTIARYMEGQIPSREYSDIIKNALTSPEYMKKLLIENRDKLTDAAYKKAMSAIDDIQTLFSVSDKMLRVICELFKKLEEVTPLMLQKLLYFIQGVSLGIYDRAVFSEDCEAWVHGPVYPEVYDMFKDFKYNPIDDARFAIFNGTEDALTEEEKHVISLVANTFGWYSGKILEQITHSEQPWKDARCGFDESIPSNEKIEKSCIRTYYMRINEQYNIGTEQGLRCYIDDKLKKNIIM